MLNTRLTSIAEETRIRWLQTRTRADSLLSKVKDVINSGIYRAEDTLSHLWALLSGGWEETKNHSSDAYEKGKDKGAEGQAYLEKKAGETRDWVQEKADGARETAGEKIKVGGQKIKGEL